MSINVYSPSQLANVGFNPDNSWIEEKPLWTKCPTVAGSSKTIPSPVPGFNTQYPRILEGASTADDDWRKPAKIKKPKSKKLGSYIRPAPGVSSLARPAKDEGMFLGHPSNCSSATFFAQH